MKIGALYDIHGNLPALEAVLPELNRVDLVLVGGDVVWGPWPRETMDALLALPNVAFIMGNADRAVCERAEGRWKEANDWCADRLTAEHLAFLRSRPATFAADGIFFCHGSPRCDTDTITVGTPDERIAAWCASVDESTVVCGHTHAQFERRVGPWRVVNPGSVGNPGSSSCRQADMPGPNTDSGSFWLERSGNISLVAVSDAVAPRCHVTAHSLTHEGGRRTPARRSRNGLLQLGWSHFWLLIGILGGMLALVVLVFFVRVSSL